MEKENDRGRGRGKGGELMRQRERGGEIEIEEDRGRTFDQSSLEGEGKRGRDKETEGMRVEKRERERMCVIFLGCRHLKYLHNSSQLFISFFVYLLPNYEVYIQHRLIEIVLVSTCFVILDSLIKSLRSLKRTFAIHINKQ